MMNGHRVINEFNNFLTKEDLLSYRDEIDAILTRYQGVMGGLIPVLQHVQELIKYLPAQVQDYIAFALGLPSASVFGVVSFYSFFTMTPRGRNIIKVCLGTACYVKGAPRIVEKIESGCKLKLGTTSDDRRFTLLGVRCLGACGLAPVVVVNDTTMGQVDPTKIMKILNKYE